MPKSPLIFKSTHRVTFSDLDPHNHVRTEAYSGYYIDHRLNCVRDYIGWDLKTLSELPFMLWVRRLEIDFVKPARGDAELTITSFVREFQGSNAFIEGRIVDEAEQEISRCLMVVACVDRRTRRSMDWPEEARALFYRES
jgi:acyl-CoA thioester hydrolase